jgi:hypothetical protein
MGFAGLTPYVYSPYLNERGHGLLVTNERVEFEN